MPRSRSFAAAVAVEMCLAASVQALHRPMPHLLKMSRESEGTQQWFTQKLDHYNAASNVTFQQRYWTNSSFRATSSDVAIIYINGEGPAGAPNLPEVVMLAQQFNAFFCTLEHRYYGYSSPLGNVTTESLQFLSSKQALSDLAAFQAAMDAMLVTQSGGQPLPDGQLTFNWIVIGGSYSGALTAWYRTKFPQLTVGGIASSGVVNAIINFTAFDEQVAASAGPACADVLRKANRLLEAQQATNNASVKAMFGASMLVDDGDFYYFIGDTMATSVQYGYKDYLCDTFMNASTNGSDLVQTFATFVTEWWNPTFGGPESYATTYQQVVNVTWDMNYRQWWYQKCTEFGYFQVAPPTGNIRSSQVDLAYHARHCQALFGLPLWPEASWTNVFYGGAQPKATNVIFFNGSQDPWRHASVPTGYTTSTEKSDIVTCDNCGHCVDLGGCPLGGCSAQLNAAWNLTRTTVDGWLNAARAARAH